MLPLEASRRSGSGVLRSSSRLCPRSPLAFLAVALVAAGLALAAIIATRRCSGMPIAAVQEAVQHGELSCMRAAVGAWGGEPLTSARSCRCCTPGADHRRAISPQQQQQALVSPALTVAREALARHRRSPGAAHTIPRIIHQARAPRGGGRSLLQARCESRTEVPLVVTRCCRCTACSRVRQARRRSRRSAPSTRSGARSLATNRRRARQRRRGMPRTRHGAIARHLPWQAAQPQPHARAVGTARPGQHGGYVLAQPGRDVEVRSC